MPGSAGELAISGLIKELQSTKDSVQLLTEQCRNNKEQIQILRIRADDCDKAVQDKTEKISELQEKLEQSSFALYERQTKDLDFIFEAAHDHPAMLCETTRREMQDMEAEFNRLTLVKRDRLHTLDISLVKADTRLKTLRHHVDEQEQKLSSAMSSRTCARLERSNFWQRIRRSRKKVLGDGSEPRGIDVDPLSLSRILGSVNYVLPGQYVEDKMVKKWAEEGGGG